jgi:hypothetical protein
MSALSFYEKQRYLNAQNTQERRSITERAEFEKTLSKIIWTERTGLPYYPRGTVIL